MTSRPVESPINAVLLLHRRVRSRCVGGLVVIGLASAIAWYSALIALRADYPEFVMRIAPNDGVAQSLILDRAMGRQQDILGRVTDKKALLAALRQDPLQASVLRWLATSNTNHASSLALLQQAHAVSRRDLATEIGLVEISVSQNDVPRALEHYDAALSTHEEAWLQLFPLLARALDHDEVRESLKAYLSRRSHWVGAFLSYAAENAKVESVLALLNDNVDTVGEGDLSRLRQKILARLVRVNAYPEAFALALSIAPDLDPFRGMDVDAKTANPALRPFTWALPVRAVTTTRFLSGGGAAIQLPRNKITVALTRVLFLPTGRYDFATNMAFSIDDKMVSAIWEWRCIRNDGREKPIARAVFPASTQAQTLEMDVPVTEECKALRVNLLVDAGDIPTGAQVAIYAAGLRKHSGTTEAP